MYKIKPIAASLVAISGVVSGIFLAPAFAQQTDEKKTQEAQRIQKIEVTGSNIKRTDTETVAPVTVITREQIEKSGRATISDVLRELPVNSAQSFSETSLNSFASGGAAISLRGLGGLGTLVLFNGRRVANYPFAANLDETFVDLNQIPASVVERVEILKDGASALYGSDAIAGVVNIVFRRDFTGLEASGRIGGETNGSSKFAAGAVTFGKGDLGSDKYNFFAVVDVFKRDGSLRSDFELTKSADYSRYFSGEDGRGSTGGTWRAITGPAAIRNTRFPVANCPTELIPASRLASVLTGTSCVGDVGPKVTSLLPDQQRVSMYGKGTLEISDSLSAFADVGISRNNVDVLQDYNYLTAGATRFVTSIVNGNRFLTPQSVRYAIAPGVAGNPTGQFAELLIPTYDLGVKRQEIESTNTKFSAGLKGSHLGWDWDSAAAIAKAKATAEYSNLISYSGLVRTGTLAPQAGFILVNGAIAAPGGFVPLGTNSQAVIDAMRTSTKRESSASVQSIDFKASREVAQLPAGPLGLAVGVDVRREKLEDTPDPKLLAGDILNFGYTGTTGSRRVSAGFAELSIPIVRALEAQVAVRHDQYSDFGNATSPKAGVKWKVSDDAVLRANYGKGFRAPSLPQISNSDSTAFTSYFDYAGCFDFAYAPACQGINQGTGTSVGTIIRSNKNLKPELSETMTLGLVIAPSRDTSMALDVYKIRWSNLVGSQNIQNVLEDEYVLGLARPDVLVRDPVNGGLIGVVNQFINFSTIVTRGFDFDFRTRFDLDFGKLGVALEGSYVHKFTSSDSEPLWTGGATTETNFAGRNLGTQSAFPRVRANLRFDLDVGQWGVGLRSNVVGRYRQGARLNNAGQVIANFRGERRAAHIREQVTFDLSAQYRLSTKTSIFGSVLNVADQMPPFDPRMSSYGFAVDQYPPRGRTASLSVRHVF